MATSARRPSSQDNYHLLETQPTAERAQALRQNGASGTNRPVVWGSLTALGGAAAGSAAWVAVKSFTNGDKVGGGLLAGVAVFCVCAGCYALSRLVGSLSNRNIQLIAPNGDIEEGVPANKDEAVLADYKVEAAKAHPVALREIHTTVLQILHQHTQNDLEAVLDGSDLHQSIRKHLAVLETKLLALTHANGELTHANGELTQLKVKLEKAIATLQQEADRLKEELKSIAQSRSGISMGAGLDSPGAGEIHLQTELLAGFDALESRVNKAQASNNSSASSSKEQIGGLNQDSKSFLQSRSEISMGAGLDSPGAGGIPFQTNILEEFDDIGANVHKAQASNNSSAFSSYTTSPAGNLSSFAALTPTSSEKTISPTARELFPNEDSEATPPPNEERQ